MATKAEDVDDYAKSTPHVAESSVQDTRVAETAKDVDGATPRKGIEPHSFENAPDPDEDNLDDLDDMLDEFSPITTEPKNASIDVSRINQTTTDAPPDNVPEFDEMTGEDFARQLQADMANLLGGIDANPELAAQFEDMMNKITADNGAGVGDLGTHSHPETGGAPTQSSKNAPPVGAEESFQDTIRKTMEKIQASGEQATAAAKEEDTDDILAELLKQMQASGVDDETGEEDFSKMLLGMMEQLTNKDILYEPMKELHDKFPAWMEKNKTLVSREDLDRYKEQQRVVAEIVSKFEEPAYTDASAPDREYIVERMQLMQAAGSPPADLVGDMASAQEAFGAPDEGCPQQ